MEGIGQRIYEERKKKGISQGELGGETRSLSQSGQQMGNR